MQRPCTHGYKKYVTKVVEKEMLYGNVALYFGSPNDYDIELSDLVLKLVDLGTSFPGVLLDPGRMLVMIGSRPRRGR